MNTRFVTAVLTASLLVVFASDALSAQQNGAGDSNTTLPHVVRQVQPVYPAQAIAQEIQGDVVIHAVVSPEGDVNSLTVVSGNRVLTTAALVAVAQWHFDPATRDGAPVIGEINIQVRFNPPHTRVAADDASSAPSTPAPPIPSYQESGSGLTKMMKQMLDLNKNGDENALSGYYKALILPNAGPWFAAQFGASLADTFTQDYRSVERQMHDVFAQAMQSGSGLKFDAVEVRRFKDSCDPAADEFEYPVLSAREQGVLLYEVRFMKDSTYRTMFPFAYVDGQFRYLGNLPIAAPRNRFPNPDTRLGPNDAFVAPKLIKQVDPIYPEEILQGRNAGLAKIWGVVGTDGALRDIHAVSGTCSFNRALADAAKKWKFSPGTINRQPVDVVFTFEFNFVGRGQ